MNRNTGAHRSFAARHTVSPVETLRDFTTTWRVLPISGLAVVIGVVAAYVAAGLLRLIEILGIIGLEDLLKARELTLEEEHKKERVLRLHLPPALRRLPMMEETEKIS